MEIINDVEVFEELAKSENLLVVHFSADFIPQCEQVDEILLALMKQPEYSKTQFVKVLAENSPEISVSYDIVAAPTILFFKSDKVIERVDGAHPGKITEAVIKHSGSNDAPKAPLEERLKALINKANVMLFMKGDRTTPRCGFSRTIIGILNSTGVAYETFDILTDEEVRQGLKTYSDWPTYPQLYVKGELLGGLDIIKEMQEADELLDCLKN